MVVTYRFSYLCSLLRIHMLVTNGVYIQAMITRIALLMLLRTSPTQYVDFVIFSFLSFVAKPWSHFLKEFGYFLYVLRFSYNSLYA